MILRRRPRGFELVGMPGSGKSTIFALLKERLAQSGGGVAVVADLPPGEAEEYVRGELPALWEASMPFIEAVGARRAEMGHGPVEKMTRMASRLWFGRAAMVHQADARRGVTLLEEGTVHELWRLAYLLRGTGRDVEAVRELSRLMPRSTAVLHIDAGEETRARRMAGKAKLGPINRDLAVHGPGSQVWSETGAVYERLLREAGRWPRRRVRLANDGDQDLPTVSDEILRSLHRAEALW